jgi:acetyltransferase
VAIIGASPKKGEVGNVILNNLLHGSRKAGKTDSVRSFKGEIYPIDPMNNEIMGIKTYNSIAEAPKPVELAVLCIHPQFIKEAIDQCGSAGVKSAVVITAGFPETKEDIKKIEKEVLPLVKKYNIRILGPNCFGIINPFHNFNVSIGDVFPQPGPISFISQSSTLCTSVIHYSLEEYLGFSNLVSIGVKIDLDDADIIDYLHKDENTKCIMMYIEYLKNTHNFFKTARRVVKDIPIVALKSSYSEEGARAAKTGKGKLMGFESEYDLAFKQAGIFQAKTLSELFDASRALAYMPVPKGENIVILTNAGGPGVLASDTAHRLGMNLAKLQDSTLKKLDQVCPLNWYAGDHVNIIGDAPVFRYRDALSILMNAKEVDGVVLLHSPTIKLSPLKLASYIVDIYQATKKPITVSYVGMVNKVSENFLDSHGIPEIEYPERAVFAMYALVERMRYLSKD